MTRRASLLIALTILFAAAWLIQARQPSDFVDLSISSSTPIQDAASGEVADNHIRTFKGQNVDWIEAVFRPMVVRPPDPPEPIDPLSSARLLGVIARVGDAVAIVEWDGQAAPVRLRVGMKLGTWVVQEIMPKQVDLVRGRTISTLLLDPKP
jgi:hypothetical protein